MPHDGPVDDRIAGYLKEFDFIREGMRQDQRERQGFLGFALAASGLILGFAHALSPTRSPTEACFLVGLAAIVTIVAEKLTIRASLGVASVGVYLRLFVEPHVQGLGFQRPPHVSRWSRAREEYGAPRTARVVAG